MPETAMPERVKEGDLDEACELWRGHHVSVSTACQIERSAVTSELQRRMLA